jgi:dihydroorotate dehydrogenase electron transfer subunit
MYVGKGQVVELILDNGFRHARISCAGNLIPSPGQYLLAGSASQSDPLPVSLFSTDSAPESGNMPPLRYFIACAPIPENWTPGTELTLRGPLGHGFTLPTSARKVVLVAFDDSPARLQELMRHALKQGAAVVLVCDSSEIHMPDEVEIQPLSALREAVEWADYTAFDVARENLPKLKEILGEQNQMSVKNEAQVLIRTPMPCGGVAECGVCAVTLKSNWKLSCKDGPVFDWSEF